MSPRYSSAARASSASTSAPPKASGSRSASSASDPNGVSVHHARPPPTVCVRISASERYVAAPRSSGAAPPTAAAPQDAARNSAEVATRSCERVRTRSGSHTTTTDRGGSWSTSSSIACGTSTGASDSMPSTAMPSASLAKTSRSSGYAVCSSASAAARARTAVVEQQLAARRRVQPALGHLEAALVGDLEPADLLDGVAPELHPQRVLLGGREDVDDPAAHGELAAALDQVHPGVRRRGEPLDHVVQPGVLAGVQGDRPQVAEAGDQRLQQRAGRRHDDAGARRGGVVLGMRQPAQGRQPAADGVGAGGQPLVRQRLPGRELEHRLARQHRAQGGGEVLGLARGRGHREHERRGAVRGERRQHGRPGAGRRLEVEGGPVAGPGGAHGLGERGVAAQHLEQAGQAHSGRAPVSR